MGVGSRRSASGSGEELLDERLDLPEPFRGVYVVLISPPRHQGHEGALRLPRCLHGEVFVENVLYNGGRRSAPGQAFMQNERDLDYDSPDVPKVRLFVAAAAGLSGLVYAVVIAGLAVAMSGAGHGWNSAGISFSGLVLIPVAAISLVYRRKTACTLLAIAVLLGGLGADVWLIRASHAEGIEYMKRAWTALPVITFTWFAMWAGWQVALVAVLSMMIRPDE